MAIVVARTRDMQSIFLSNLDYDLIHDKRLNGFPLCHRGSQSIRLLMAGSDLPSIFFSFECQK